MQVAAQKHSVDVINNRELTGHVGSDGSTPTERASATGFEGDVAETIAVHPALAISGVELIRQWYYDPVDYGVMANCAHTQVGVWSEHSMDRTVVVAVYGSPR